VWVFAGRATAVRDPGGSVGGEYEVERLASLILLNTHGLIRIADEENINAVVAITGDPDVTSPNADETNSLRSTRSLANLLATCVHVAGSVRGHPLCPERAALVAIGN